MLTILECENAIIDLFLKNRIEAIYNTELVKEPERREIIISNIEKQKEFIPQKILGVP